MIHQKITPVKETCLKNTKLGLSDIKVLERMYKLFYLQIHLKVFGSTTSVIPSKNKTSKS